MAQKGCDGIMICRISVRFNLDKPLPQKAWEYLQTMDKTAHKSYSNVITHALVEYFERYNRSKDDPYFENREREDRFADRIVEEVGRRINTMLPAMIVSKAIHNNDKNIEIAEETEMDKDIDWDFAGRG